MKLVDRAAIFTDILSRNALRREARLPLRDVRATYDHEVEQAEWAMHVEQRHDATRAEVVANLRAKYGAAWGHSTGARWQVAIIVGQQLAASFRSQRGRG